VARKRIFFRPDVLGSFLAVTLLAGAEQEMMDYLEF
jgi:hypothetical protein